MAAMHSVSTPAPQVEPASLFKSEERDVSSYEATPRPNN